MTRPPGRAYLGHARQRPGDGGIVVESGSEDGYVDVLVVDDDEALRTSMVEILSRAGYTVSDAQDGRGALERLASTEVGVMLLDMQMPELDGLGVLLEAPVPRPPVIVVSAHRYDALHQPPEADVFLFLRKPVPPEELLDAVQLALVGHEASGP